MPHAVEAALREELRHAGLGAHGAAPRLLALLRQSVETHLTLPDIADLAAEAGLAITQAELRHQLDGLVRHGLIAQLPTTGGDLVYDTVAKAHAHLVYEDTQQIVDLHVSNETLLVMLRDALAQRPDGVEVMVRFRRTSPAAHR